MVFYRSLFHVGGCRKIEIASISHCILPHLAVVKMITREINTSGPFKS